MSSCKNCSNTDICRIFEFINQQKSIANIDVTSCKKNNSDAIKIVERVLPVNQDVSNYIAKMRPNLNNDAESDINIQVKEASEERIEMECRTCKGKIYLEDVNVCAKCGKDICTCCATSYNGSDYCEECWEAL